MTDPVMLLSQLHGEGRVTFRALRDAGFFTLASVADATVQSLADRAHLSARTARRLKAGAEEMVGSGIGLDSVPTDPARRRGRNGLLRSAEPEPAPAMLFSEGVSLEEAEWLGQASHPAARPSKEPERSSDRSADPPGAQVEPDTTVLPAPRLPDVSAAAEAAAALSRSAPRPADKRPAYGSAEACDPSFWTFG
ncbi:MAG TPA: helix-hairpin-helix domain-containing protein [Candidatus Polarisedimenticolia bacterium]|nr:helix-hairpin-helix domain-containing protein [Candidatus Polarisedimenticolia bacterium]